MDRSNRRRTRVATCIAVAVAAAVAMPRALDAFAAGRVAHEVPASVTVLAFVHPEGNRLRLLVRAPLDAMRDIAFPTHGPGYLDIEAAHGALRDAARLWIADYLDVFENDRELGGARIAAIRVSLPSDRSFTNYEDALANVLGPSLPAATELPWQQAMMDVLFEYDIASDQSRFALRPALAHLGIRTMTVLRFRPPGGAERVFQYFGDPGLVRLDPRLHQAVFRFIRLGFLHILDGVDHILFVLCLVIPFRRIRPLLAIVTSFTIAHSITLIASALGLAPSALWFPPLIETLIALSIVWMAFENIVGARVDRRWLIAFAFGLVHGFGFSFILRESMQFAGGHLLSSLIAFNVGVELGQVFVLALAIPALALLFRYVVAERMGVILLSALVAHTAWHWMLERGSSLGEYDYAWPALDIALLVSAMRALMLLLIIAASLWLLHGMVSRLSRTGPERPADAEG